MGKALEMEHREIDGGIETYLTTLLALLDAHNSKEEPIIYAQAEKILGTAASAELLDFLAQGTTPDGWVCAAA